MADDDQDYSPVGIYSDDEELAKYPYPPVAPPPSGDMAAPAYPPVASAPPEGSPFPSPYSAGSTDDLEMRAAHPIHPAQSPVETERPQWGDYAPPQPQGFWSKLGHGLAAINPRTNEYFNVRPEKQAEEAYKNATTEYEAPINEASKEAQTEEAQARADALKNPPAKQGLTPEETTIHDLMTGENGQPRVNPETGKPYSYLEAFGAVNQAKQDTKAAPKQNDFEQFYSDWLKDNNFPDTAHNRLMARKQFAAAGQSPERPPRQMIVTPDNKVLEVGPGDTIPQGSKTVSGDLAGNKPTADEERRADLARNMNENLDQLEEIVKRRGDLFGPAAGRWTQLKGVVGTSDNDIAALNTIKEMMGMAQVGAHAMRNAQHVETAANSILNSFHNSPEAILEAIKKARSSVATFQQDAGQQPGSAPKNSPAGGGAPVKYEKGLVRNGYKFMGGDPTDKNNWEKVQEKTKP